MVHPLKLAVFILERRQCCVFSIITTTQKKHEGFLKMRDAQRPIIFEG